MSQCGSQTHAETLEAVWMPSLRGHGAVPAEPIWTAVTGIVGSTSDTLSAGRQEASWVLL